MSGEGSVVSHGSLAFLPKSPDTLATGIVSEKIENVNITVYFRYFKRPSFAYFSHVCVLIRRLSLLSPAHLREKPQNFPRGKILKLSRWQGSMRK